jgi:primosomal protein N'
VSRVRIRFKEGNIMKSFGTISTTALFLILGLAVPAHARQEKQEENTKPPKQEQQAKPEKQQEAKPQKQEQAKPEKQAQAKPEKQQQAKPQQQQKQQQQAAKSEKQQQQHSQQQAKGQQEHQQQAKSDKQQHQQQTASSHGGPQRTQQAEARQRAQPELHLSDRGSGRIPDDRFRSHFGRGHSFHMGNPVMVSGYSRFQYGGYWFGFVDPWPVDWYYTDDFYIDYVDGGYYMYNPYYPGARFAITVVI